MIKAWQDLSGGVEMPSDTRGWLATTGSLTQKLKKFCSEKFQFSLKDEAWMYPNTEEAALLNLKPNEKCKQRQVVLGDPNTIQVFGQSLLPEGFFNYQVGFKEQDQKPLGHWLFAQANISRSAIAVKKIDRSDALYHEAKKFLPEADYYWARYSTFDLPQATILIYEVFYLPKSQYPDKLQA